MNSYIRAVLSCRNRALDSKPLTGEAAGAEGAGDVLLPRASSKESPGPECISPPHHGSQSSL